jgi:2,4-dienoyl-CoA reductase-like NADH-dependent reductase (Old Yellow Enzyme family)
MIGAMPVRNCIVMAPMNTGFAGPNGEVTSRMVDYYEKRAKNGVGLIVIEATGVVPDVKNMACQPRLSDDAYLPGFATLVERIKVHEVRTLLQIQHSGNEAAFGELVSASEISSKAVGGMPTPLTLPEIETLTARFVETAERAYRAGFDGIEVHAAHGYLLNQFLSPFFNRRLDRFGGSTENRARMVVDIIQRIKSLLGPGFVVTVRYSAREFIEGGLDVDESIRLASIFQNAGADALHIASGIYDSGLFISGPASVPQGMFVPTARRIKQAVDIPIIVVGRINDPFFAEQVLKEGSADMIAFGRAFLGDPAFPAKLYQNRPEDIRKCIGCRYCGSRVSANLDVRCAVNPETGRERYFPETTVTRNPRNVLVIGGGPAGASAAITAAEIGHRVTIVEKTEQLGGQLNLAVKPPFKEVHYLLDYQKNRIRKLNIDVRLETDADLTMIESMQPDTVIVATGAIPKKPPFPVKGNHHLITAWDALAFPDQVGDNVVIVGGGSVGCETAEFLAGMKVKVEYQTMIGQGPEIRYRVIEKAKPKIQRNITIIELLDSVAGDEEWGNRALLMIRLAESGVKIMTGAVTEGIDEGTLFYHDKTTGKKGLLKADTFVIATGTESDRKLMGELSSMPVQLISIGDCQKPGTIRDAIYQGVSAIQRII